MIMAFFPLAPDGLLLLMSVMLIEYAILRNIRYL